MNTATVRPAVPQALYAAVYDYQDARSRHDGALFHFDFGGHLHLIAPAGLHAVAEAGPDQDARIVVTGACPVCDPDGYAAAVAAGRAFEYAPEA